ncbi:MAG TPA: DUF4350 domain-containing protein [Caulobacteraceae bacterium]|nr:DUF4350 domain-containing protein [Caulobacteraceae bacterium]
MSPRTAAAGVAARADGVQETPLVTPARAALLTLVAVFAFTTLILLAAFGPMLKSGDDGRAHALSRSAIGYAGLARALRLSGETVVINRDVLGANRREGLVIVTPGPSASAAAVRALGFQGPTLVIAPKWDAAPEPRHHGWVQEGQVLTGTGEFATDWARGRDAAQPRLQASGAPFMGGETLTEGPVKALRAALPKGWIPVLRTQDGDTILARAPDRPLYLLSDADLMNNHGLKDERTFETALLIVHTLEAGDGPVIFDLRLSGLSAGRTPMRLLFDQPFVAVTLALTAAAALAGWQAFTRFGAPLAAPRAIALGKAALVDNSAALVRLAGREHRMAARYAQLTVELSARAAGLPRDLEPAGQRRLLDRIGERRDALDSLEALCLSAATCQTPQRAAEIGMRLFRWRHELTGESSGDGAQRGAIAGWRARRRKLSLRSS